MLEAYKHLWDTLLAGEPVKEELKNKTKDGRIIDIEASNNPIIDSSFNSHLIKLAKPDALTTFGRYDYN